MADDTIKIVGRKRKAAPVDSKTLNALSVSTKSADQKSVEHSKLEERADENSGSLKPFVQANAAILDGMAALNAEILAFGNKRLSANIKRSRSLTGCGNVEQAFRVQFEFFESAVQQYLNQACKMMEIMAFITWWVWGPLGENPKMNPSKTAPLEDRN